ncbi:hypothetical protein EOE18_15035 [Novosphingobium umbonatum]|uniref:Uncharacterized protein n=1 Tax=Novosphingobium umbonatum TaxID=1908524 RepID=A0A3S3TL96_9SPHN|nr:hypothetical protein [Novosphingobium umbonatum]RVU03632.1 hypothetical protein EOE18_15035 [Novosphingobium umbonatum]
MGGMGKQALGSVFLLLMGGGTALAQEAPDAPTAAPPTLFQSLIDEPMEVSEVEDPVILADELAPDIQRGMDAVLAASIAATGQFTGFDVESWQVIPDNGPHHRPIVVNGLSAKRGAMVVDPGLQWSQLGKGQFALPGSVALGVEQKFADARTWATQMRLSRVAGPVDLAVNVKGNKTLVSDKPMRLSYDSTALVHVNSALAFGMVAKGDLGTLDNFAPYTRHDAGAVARLKLKGKYSSLSAETGYDVRMGPGSDTMPSRVYMNLNFNWKL